MDLAPYHFFAERTLASLDLHLNRRAGFVVAVSMNVTERAPRPSMSKPVATQFCLKESRERSKMAVNCFAMTLRPIPFFMEDAKPATWSVETRAR